MENNTIKEDQQVIDEENINSLENNCTMTNTLKIIGGKWKMLLLNCFREECPVRFGKIKSKMPNITQTTLTAQLRELERDGILSRQSYAESPPRVEYKLTELGKTLMPVMQTLCDWGETYCAVREEEAFDLNDGLNTL